MDGREKKVVRVLPCSRSVHLLLPLPSCEEGGNGTQEVEQMQKQTVRRQPRPASRRVHTNGNPATASGTSAGLRISCEI